MSPASSRVVILLATMNGAKFLRQQLESFQAQTHQNWTLLVSDDGSTDSTLSILADFAAQVDQPVIVRRGPRQGFWQNFMSLVRTEDVDGEFIVYSDQDDIWHSEKLARAVDWLATIPADVPALYFTRTELIEQDGSPIGLSPLFTRAPSFQNALVQNIGGGNTMAFNRAALQAVRSAPIDVSLVSHDWWTYQIVTGIGGIAHYDPKPSLYYRQHRANIVGSNVGLRARLIRLIAFANGRVIAWNDINLRLLASRRSMLTPQNQASLEDFIKARQALLPVRLWLVWKSGVYRQSFVENLGLYVGAFFGRL